MITYKAAPLPFQGQNRNFVEPFKTALRELKEKQDITIIIDLFGGSVLNTHNVSLNKQARYTDMMFYKFVGDTPPAGE